MTNPLLSKITKLENEMMELKAGTDKKNTELEKIMIS